MKKQSPRTRRHIRTRQAILDAALSIVHEDGPDGLSMRTLADRIDYSPAGLYEYFGSKEEIIAEVCDEGHRRLAAYMLEVESSLSSTDYLYGIGLAYIRFALENPDHFLLMFSSPQMAGDAPEDALPQDSESSYGILLHGIERGIDAGAFHVRPGFGLSEMGYAAWTLVHGMAMLRVTALRDVPLDLDAADHQALLNFMRGLQAA
ncbi:MAG: TetR/AcrR family transcriptional regulator [Anaerolineae bacterium]|nr:TetR/AcrR family transcriptional regulator [Anaerolineae bacterium]MCB9131377.1 TetR/AcrR family transcriptional regulator [Anaerolineales bacterium]MCB0236195.1 TetR/AcrR family transcriptional regulator [Anaerolineae bacterium]MCB0243928.1 TetR/AcrR family transcriptional regulator [Anaerolineae bacterium]MCB0247237.1 TetR/AcrR family transcriptional regulator [Anaerolineae bacterium]